MTLLDLFRRRGSRGSTTSDRDFVNIEGLPDEPGEGGPSIFVRELAAQRWAAQQEALNVGNLPLEPAQWPGGRMAFAHERQQAHDHEALRDRLSDFVSAEVRDCTEELYELTADVAAERDRLRVADRDLAVVQDSWNRAYREVHEDELELGRYFRHKSITYRGTKWILAGLLFFAEFAVSIALFNEVVEQDIPAMPVLFALGLIMILIVIPHYAAIAIKDGVLRYHQAELDAYRDGEAPAQVRKKARIEEVEDTGAKFAAGIVGMLLVALVLPLSSLRATELGGEDEQRFWFWFFLLLQGTISGYFFLREWLDHGTAAANLKHHDESRKTAETARQKAMEAYTESVSAFMTSAQQLLFLYRQAPRWDSYITQSYLTTIHHFRHLVTLENPELDVFIANATVPSLQSRRGVIDETVSAADRELDPVAREHPALDSPGIHGRQWWLDQVTHALGTVSDADDAGMAHSELPAPHHAFENPQRLLAELLDHYYGLEYPYRRPPIHDVIERVDRDPFPASASAPAMPGVADELTPDEWALAADGDESAASRPLPAETSGPAHHTPVATATPKQRVPADD